jgi:hypothetical protein
MINVVPGDEVVVIRDGKFGPSSSVSVPAGTKGRVTQISNGGKKRWAYVEVYGKAHNIIGVFRIPAWWLRPRSVLGKNPDPLKGMGL